MTNAIDRLVKARQRAAMADREALAREVILLTSATTSSAGAAALLRASRGPGMGRWRVERSGALRGGYGPGWFAFSGIRDMDAHGAWFATWSEAMAFAVRQAV